MGNILVLDFAQEGAESALPLYCIPPAQRSNVLYCTALYCTVAHGRT